MLMSSCRRKGVRRLRAIIARWVRYRRWVRAIQTEENRLRKKQAPIEGLRRPDAEEKAADRILWLCTSLRSSRGWLGKAGSRCEICDQHSSEVIHLVLDHDGEEVSSFDLVLLPVAVQRTHLDA